MQPCVIAGIEFNFVTFSKYANNFVIRNLCPVSNISRTTESRGSLATLTSAFENYFPRLLKALIFIVTSSTRSPAALSYRSYVCDVIK